MPYRLENILGVVLFLNSNQESNKIIISKWFELFDIETNLIKWFVQYVAWRSDYSP